MKLACITVTFNESYLIEKWVEYYKIYKDEIDLHIIVDNGSCNEYKLLLRRNFPDSTILFREVNGGVTAAFNDGIRYAIEDKEIGSIVLICPDIKYQKGALTLMKEALLNRPDVGIIGPLMYNEQKTIAILGANLSRYLAPRFIETSNLDDFPDEFEVDFISGGINMIRREMFEKVGFQNEVLFMYGDEVDFDIRVKKAGFKIIALKKSVCWHNHIYKDKSLLRSTLTYFLLSRNTFILYRHHLFGINKIMGYLRFCYYAFLEIIGLLKKREFKRAIAYIEGIVFGVIKLNKIPVKYL